MSRDHYKGIPKNRDARIGADGKLQPLDKKGGQPAIALFNQGHVGSSVVTTRDDGEIVHVYIDPIDGNDQNEGLTPATALKSVSAFYSKFPIRMYNDSACVVNFVNNTNSVVEVVTNGLHLGGGSGLIRNPVVYRGPEMILSSLATGPNTVELDGTPAVRVDASGVSSGTGNSTRLDFTVASPGWTVNNLKFSFVRVTRAGVRVFDELPISSNTSNTLTVDTLNIVGNILSTDKVDIVRPAIKIKGTAPDYTLLSIWRDAGGATMSHNFIADTVGPTFSRLSFCQIICQGVGGLQFDRCTLNEDFSGGSSFDGGTYLFKNTLSKWHIILMGGSGSSVAGRSDDAPLNTTAMVELIQFNGQLSIGGIGSDYWSTGTGTLRTIGTVAVYGDGIKIDGGGSSFVALGAVLGSNPGHAGIHCRHGGTAHIQGGNLSVITGSLGDLKVGSGATISYGTAAGELEEVAGWNGNFTRILEGTATSPNGDTSRITTTIPVF